MGDRHRVIDDQDEILALAVHELVEVVSPIVVELVEARARFLLAAQIERLELVPRASVTDQPTAHEVLRAVLARLADHASTPGATATGAHDLARRVGRSLGVHEADSCRAFRRTRAEIDDDPNPRRKREGTQGLVGGVLRGEVATR